MGDAFWNLGDEPRGGVHLADEVVHAIERFLGCVNNQIDALTQDIELRVGDQDGNFDQNIFLQIQPGHLAINPDQIRCLITHSRTLEHGEEVGRFHFPFIF